jgi:hypothetical protein
MAQIHVTTRLRRKVEEAGSGGVGAVEGPFLAWCQKPYPGGDDKTLIFAYHNLPADAVITWTLTPGAEFVEIIGPSDAHICVVRSQGSSGVISGTVNGEPVGDPIAFTFADCAE